MLFDRKKFWDLGGFHEQIQFGEDYRLSQQVERKRFAIVRGGVYTTNRRFKRMGHLKVGWLFLKTGMNFWNEKFFLRDHKYWANEADGMPQLGIILSAYRLTFCCGHRDRVQPTSRTLFYFCSRFLSEADHDSGRDSNVTLMGTEQRRVHVISLNAPRKYFEDLVIEAAAYGCGERCVRGTSIHVDVPRTEQRFTEGANLSQQTQTHGGQTSNCFH